MNFREILPIFSCNISQSNTTKKSTTKRLKECVHSLASFAMLIFSESKKITPFYRFKQLLFTACYGMIPMYDRCYILHNPYYVIYSSGIFSICRRCTRPLSTV